ncbi:ATPase, T2SS/T4P/T4SS family [Mycobacterium tuberculosis]
MCGGTGAGKATLLAAMLGASVAHERIVCVEDAAELALGIHIWSSWLRGVRTSKESVEVTVRQLVRQALRMRPGPHVVGEAAHEKRESVSR